MTPSGSTPQTPAYALVLSGGRTGTTYLTELMQKAYPRALVLQEPIPSRSLWMLSNAADWGFPTRELALRIFWTTRRSWLRRNGNYSRLVEINPFLTPYAHLLRPEHGNPRILHIVRHPFTWVSSILAFKAHGWRAHFVPHLPLAHGRPREAAEFWSGLTDVERFAWRWKKINERIESCGRNGLSYLRIRYEDMFERDRPVFETMRAAIEHLGMDASLLPADVFCLSKRVNCAPVPTSGIWPRWSDELKRSIISVAQPYADRYGYGMM